MQTLFYVCFGVGIGYVLIGFLLGEVFGFLHFDFDTDVHFDGMISPLKPSVIAAFLTVFGGVGIIAISRLNVVSALFVAALAGFCVAYLFYRFVIIPLYKAQNTSVVEKQSLIGHNATVTETILQGKFGKITYFANGNTYSAPAKSEEGKEIKKMEHVEIIYIDKNTFYVRKKGF